MASHKLKLSTGPKHYSTRKERVMMLHHYEAEVRESVRYSPHIRTLSDYPLLLGEVLRRDDLRRQRRTKWAGFVQKFRHFFRTS